MLYKGLGASLCNTKSTTLFVVSGRWVDNWHHGNLTVVLKYENTAWGVRVGGEEVEAPAFEPAAPVLVNTTATTTTNALSNGQSYCKLKRRNDVRLTAPPIHKLDNERWLQKVRLRLG